MKLFLALSALLASAAYTKADGDDPTVVKFTDKTFEENVPAKANHFVMFYAPWCGHCKRLHPTWEELAKEHNTKENAEVIIAKVDCTEEAGLCSEYDVTGYPTLKFFKKGSTDGEKYKGQREVAAFNKFINQKLGNEEAVKEPEVATADKGLYILTENSFTNHIATGAHFIKFYAPWCGHCQRMAPTWDELAAEFADSDKVKIGKIDCTQAGSLCQEQGVGGYPTLLFFKDGKKVEKYSGARTLAELKDFVVSSVDVKAAEKAEEKAAPAGEAGQVALLDKDSFKETTAKGVTFIKFFAPWCGHCKRLAPTWEQLAAKLTKDGKAVTIAKVDCTSNENANKELCNEQKVNGFPTLNIYVDGEKAGEYSGKRELEELEKFALKHLKDTKDEL